jgi:hypothetical protein
VAVAGTARWRTLPAFRALAAREVRLRTFETLCLLGALVGTALLGSRLLVVDDDADEMRTRDVVLCLDVSASMAPVVGDVIDAYLDLAEDLRGERLGFVMFDANAVTVFPLTTEYAHVVDRLASAREEISAGRVPGTQAPSSGSSLVGDGLVSCTDHFDRPEEQRSRTVVLATDNLVSGDSIYTLPDAIGLAREREAMVFGVMPSNSDASARTQLQDQTRTTHGDVLSLDPAGATNTVLVADAVQAQQKAAILASPHARPFDLVWPGALLLVLGVAGSWWISRRRA